MSLTGKTNCRYTAKVLRAYAQRRVTAITGIMNEAHKLYDRRTAHGNNNPVQLQWDNAFQQTLARGENDPNAILVPPIPSTK